MSSAADVDDSSSPMVRNTLWWSLQTLLQSFFCFWLGYRSVGHQQLHNIDGALLLANHQSFLDPLMIGLPLLRPISFLARHSLFPIPVVGWILKNTHVMPINQEAAGTSSIRDLIRRLQNGWLVGIFPEGTRTVDGRMNELKPGFAAVARRAKKPVIPIGIAGAFQALPMKSWFLKPARVRVVFGEPITPEELERFSGRDREAELVELVRSRIAACYEAAELWRTTGTPPKATSN